MKIIIKIGIVLLNIIYFLIKLLPVKNKITFISRQSNNPSVDIELLEKEIHKDIKNYKVVVLAKTLDSGIISKIKYLFHMIRQMYHIATSKIVILDSYSIAISILHHKKSLIVIQMWHALGAFKKFGLSIVGKEESRNNDVSVDSKELSKLMKMHANYSYIFASSYESSIGFSEAFGYPLNKFKIYPIPRLDLINDKDNVKKISNKIYKKYPELRKKKNILYCPTFRKDNSDYKSILKLLDSIDYNKYNLILKLHPLTKYDINDSRIIFDKEFNTYEMSFVSDAVISDYSAVVFEIAFMNKPIYFYAYDKNEYINKRDFYLDYDKDMPGVICTDINSLMKQIDKKYDYKRLNIFKEKYINACEQSYTKDIINFLKELLHIN